MLECHICNKTLPEHGSEDHSFDPGPFGQPQGPEPRVSLKDIQQSKNFKEMQGMLGWLGDNPVPETLPEYSERDIKDIAAMYAPRRDLYSQRREFLNELAKRMPPNDHVSVALGQLPGEIAHKLQHLFELPEVREQLGYDYDVQLESADQEQVIHRDPMTGEITIEIRHAHRIAMKPKK